MMYRREIDGLRALAVLPVMLYHAGFSLFSGGYVGVDVFFVISGFLITSILLADIEAGKFSLLNFYERRARRILPALFVVMAVCLPFAWLWLMPDEMQNFADSLMAVSGFSSNLLFWKGSGYFDTATELKPLLHTWSLAVEEQFYLLFPLFLTLALRRGRSRTAAWMAGAALLSLALSQWGATHNTGAAFYLLPSRGWELMVGALLAFVPAQRGAALRRHANLLSLAGLALILCAVFLFDRDTPFPGLYALLPTVGAALIIAFAGADTLTGKLLGSRPFVAIGLISYSAYLWHQPLFAFVRLRSFEPPGHLVMGAMLIVTLLLARLSWRYVERPFRDRARIGTRGVFALTAAGSALFVALGLVGHVSAGFETRFSPATMAAIAPARSGFEQQCRQLPFAGERRLKHCVFGDADGARTLVLYGDSHAQALFSELNRELRAKHIRGVFITNELCPIPDVFDSRKKKGPAECARIAAFLYTYLAQHADYIAVAMRWTYRLYPVPGDIDALLFDNGENGIETGDAGRINYTLADGKRSILADGKKKATMDFLNKVIASNKQVLLVYPTPEPGWHVPRMNFHSFITEARVAPTISTSFAAYEKRQRFVNTLLDGLGERPNLVRIKPSDLLCNTFVPQRCVVQTGGTPLYFDDDHLSSAGARIIASQLGKSLPPGPPHAGSSIAATPRHSALH